MIYISKVLHDWSIFRWTERELRMADSAYRIAQVQYIITMLVKL